MAIARTSLLPWVGPPGTVIDIQVPTWTSIDFTSTQKVFFAPQAFPPGLAAGTTFFGYEQQFAVVDPHHLTVTVGAIVSDPLQGLVRGTYSVIIVSAIDYMNAGNFRVLAPGENPNVPPPGADFASWWVGPYIPNWKPGGYSGYNAPPGWTFWYDSPEHPSTDLAYWWDIANWGTGGWHWAPLPAHAPPGWSIVWDDDRIHGANTSLHGWILAPDDPANPAPGVTWPPWPTVAAAPPGPIPPVAVPNTTPLPPKKAGAPLPATPPTLGAGGGGGGGGGGAARGGPSTVWAGERVPSNAGRVDALYFVSDMHLGDGSVTEDFVERCANPQTALSDQSWVSTLDWIRRDIKSLKTKEIIQGARLILNGDVFDLWSAGPSPGTVGPADTPDYQSRIANIQRAHPAFMAGINQFLAESDKYKAVILPGNHDEALLRIPHPLMDDFVAPLGANAAKLYAGNALPSPDAHGYVDDGFALVCEHGNAYDAANYDLIDFQNLYTKPTGPVLMMKGQVLVEEFVNWLESNVPKFPNDPKRAAFIASLLLVDNTQTIEEYGKYLLFYSTSQWKEIGQITAKLISALRRSRIASASAWATEVVKSVDLLGVLKGLGDSKGDDLVIVGRAPESADRRLADDILAGKRTGVPKRALIVALGHTHERVWRLTAKNGFRQVHFNTNTWTPKYRLDAKKHALVQTPDSSVQPLHPVVRVVPQPKFTGATNPTDPVAGIDLCEDVTLPSPPGVTPAWKARVSYLRLASPPPAGAKAAGGGTGTSTTGTNVEVIEVGFKDDYKITIWGTDQVVDDPDGSAPTWTKSANPDLPVAYRKGARVNLFAKLEVANPANPPVTVDIRVLMGGVEIAKKSGVSLNDNEVDVTDIAGTSALSTVVTITTPTFDWEVSYDSGQSWESAGQSGPHTMYWTYEKPFDPPFRDTKGKQYSPLYDLALDKACTYADGLADIPSIALKITEGIESEVYYAPSVLVPGHPLRIYTTGKALCWNNADLLRGLCRSIGIDATVTFYWGGKDLSTMTKYAMTSGGNVSFRVTAPKQDDAVENPHFTYHAITAISGDLYDPSYGVARPAGITVTETAQVAGAAVPTQDSTTFPTAQQSSGWTCPH